MLLAVVQAGLALGMGFGLNISAQQMALILTFTGTVLALVNRSQVTSPATLQIMTPATLATAQDAAQPLKDTIKKLPVLVLACVLSFSMLPGCAAPVTVVTPQGQTAFKADQVVVRMNELMNAAIGANTAGALPTATTKTIVEFCVAADRTLAAAPAGWQTTVAIAWAQAKVKLGVIQNPAIVAAMGAIDVVLGVVR